VSAERKRIGRPKKDPSLVLSEKVSMVLSKDDREKLDALIDHRLDLGLSGASASSVCRDAIDLLYRAEIERQPVKLSTIDEDAVLRANREERLQRVRDRKKERR
jgi:hypothetical protein